MFKWRLGPKQYKKERKSRLSERKEKLLNLAVNLSFDLSLYFF